MNTNQAIKVKNSDLSKVGLTNFRKLHNTGENFLTESGVHQLVLQSRKPETKKFKDWITDKVLPEIRKTGSYVVDNEQAKAMAVQKGVAGVTSLDTLNLIKSLIEDQEKLLLENQTMKPKAEYFDALVDRNLLTNFRDTAKELQLKQNDFVGKLLGDKFIYRDQKGNLKPYDPFTPDLFELKEFQNGKYTNVQTLITPKGRETFRLLYGR